MYLRLSKGIHDYFDSSWVCVLLQLTPEQIPYGAESIPGVTIALSFSGAAW